MTHFIIVVLFHLLPPCQQEDSHNCSWNAQQSGNHIGHSFIDVGGRTYYVNRHDQKRWGYKG